MKRSIFSFINRLFAEFSGWFLLAIMFLLILDFVSRAMVHPLQGVSELAVFVLVASVYFGIPHCEETNTHVKVELFTSILPAKLRKIINVFTYLIAVITSGIVTYAVLMNMLKAYHSREAVAGTVPLQTYPVKIIMFLGFLFYSIQLVINLLKEVKSK